MIHHPASVSPAILNPASVSISPPVHPAVISPPVIIHITITAAAVAYALLLLLL